MLSPRFASRHEKERRPFDAFPRSVFCEKRASTKQFVQILDYCTAFRTSKAGKKNFTPFRRDLYAFDAFHMQVHVFEVSRYTSILISTSDALMNLVIILLQRVFYKNSKNFIRDRLMKFFNTCYFL